MVYEVREYRSNNVDIAFGNPGNVKQFRTRDDALTYIGDRLSELFKHGYRLADISDSYVIVRKDDEGNIGIEIVEKKERKYWVFLLDEKNNVASRYIVEESEIPYVEAEAREKNLQVMYIPVDAIEDVVREYHSYDDYEDYADYWWGEPD